MIDTNELRRLAQAAMHPVTKGRWMRLFGERTVYDRMEDGCRGIPVVSTPVSPPHPFEAACLDFIAAANPAAVIELLDRIEAAEADALEQARLNGMGASREAALIAKLEAAEKERDDVAQQLVQSEIGKREISEAHDALRGEVGKLKDIEVSRCVKINGYIVDNARLAEEVERLRAILKAAENERDTLRAKIEQMEKQGPVVEVQWAAGIPNGILDFISTDDYLPKLGDKLYARPGAKGEEK